MAYFKVYQFSFFNPLFKGLNQIAIYNRAEKDKYRDRQKESRPITICMYSYKQVGDIPI